MTGFSREKRVKTTVFRVQSICHRGENYQLH